MYAANIYYWRRFRVNYPFIFGFKQGTELGYRQVLFLASGLSVLALAAALSHLDMEMDPNTRSFETVIELIPLAVVFVSLAKNSTSSTFILQLIYTKMFQKLQTPNLFFFRFCF